MSAARRTRPASPLLQRKCGCGGTCGDCSRDKAVPPIVHDVLRSPGQPLDASTRMAMEPRFGHDFSKVRVHADSRAAQSATAVGALAYAAGNHIVAGEASLPRHVMAHELAHVAQHRGGDALPRQIAPADSPAEMEADRAAMSAGPVGHAPEGTLHRYRKKGAHGFPRTVGTLVEDEFTDSEFQPWIERIDLHFNDVVIDKGMNVPKGTLTATYHSNSAALDPITFPISGGNPGWDLTSITKNNKIDRIEGYGYNDVPFPPSMGTGPRNKYGLPDASGGINASMHYALFFKGGQAIHLGSLTQGSHACVHVGLATELQMAQLNFHSVKRVTTVSTSYDALPQYLACCDLFKAKKITKKGEAPNPCHDSDPGWCPSEWW